jgi:hypothetical protein
MATVILWKKESLRNFKTCYKAMVFNSVELIQGHTNVSVEENTESRNRFMHIIT